MPVRKTIFELMRQTPLQSALSDLCSECGFPWLLLLSVLGSWLGSLDLCELSGQWIPLWQSWLLGVLGTIKGSKSEAIVAGKGVFLPLTETPPGRPPVVSIAGFKISISDPASVGHREPQQSIHGLLSRAVLLQIAALPSLLHSQKSGCGQYYEGG